MLRCPRDISPYCESILNLALEYISYDPNFTDSMEEDTDDEAQDEEDDEYLIDALTVIDKCYLFT
jgi:cullin-associated NEDD8-dissociated protein 1